MDLRSPGGEYHPEDDELLRILHSCGIESLDVGSSRLQQVRIHSYVAGFIEAKRLLAKRIRICVYAIDEVY